MASSRSSVALLVAVVALALWAGRVVVRKEYTNIGATPWVPVVRLNYSNYYPGTHRGELEDVTLVFSPPISRPRTHVGALMPTDEWRQGFVEVLGSDWTPLTTPVEVSYELRCDPTHCDRAVLNGRSFAYTAAPEGSEVVLLVLNDLESHTPVAQTALNCAETLAGLRWSLRNRWETSILLEGIAISQVSSPSLVRVLLSELLSRVLWRHWGDREPRGIKTQQETVVDAVRNDSNSTTDAEKLHMTFGFLDELWLVSVVGLTAAFMPAMVCITRPLHEVLIRLAVDFVWPVVLRLHRIGVFEALLSCLSVAVAVRSRTASRSMGVFFALTGLSLAASAFAYSTFAQGLFFRGYMNSSLFTWTGGAREFGLEEVVTIAKALISAVVVLSPSHTGTCSPPYIGSAIEVVQLLTPPSVPWNITKVCVQLNATIAGAQDVEVTLYEEDHGSPSRKEIYSRRSSVSLVTTSISWATVSLLDLVVASPRAYLGFRVYASCNQVFYNTQTLWRGRRAFWRKSSTDAWSLFGADWASDNTTVVSIRTVGQAKQGVPPAWNCSSSPLGTCVLPGWNTQICPLTSSDCGSGSTCFEGGCRGFPDTWICAISMYNQFPQLTHHPKTGSCQCNCGAWDPDCTFQQYSDIIIPHLMEIGWSMLKKNATQEGVPISFDCIENCGDGLIVGLEECDSGTFYCYKSHSFCGDSSVDPGEDCDGGSFCYWQNCTCFPGHQPYAQRSKGCRGCGNGVEEDSEECDGTEGCNPQTCTCVDAYQKRAGVVGCQLIDLLCGNGKVDTDEDDPGKNSTTVVEVHRKKDGRVTGAAAGVSIGAAVLVCGVLGAVVGIVSSIRKKEEPSRPVENPDSEINFVAAAPPGGVNLSGNVKTVFKSHASASEMAQMSPYIHSRGPDGTPIIVVPCSAGSEFALSPKVGNMEVIPGNIVPAGPVDPLVSMCLEAQLPQISAMIQQSLPPSSDVTFVATPNDQPK
eukprot:m51a1_g13833 putative serine-threonine protein (975) ;mRNA; r:491616-500799